MKKTISAGIGGKNFTLDEDAYQKLDAYLEAFKKKTGMGVQTKEVMEELELRIADLFTDSLDGKRQNVITICIVDDIISRLGMPDGSRAEEFTQTHDSSGNRSGRPVKRFYRDPECKSIAGVCGGLAAYFDIDVTILRVILLAMLVFAGLGFWIYIIFWIVAPEAETAVQKCEMRGLEPTAENIRKFAI